MRRSIQTALMLAVVVGGASALQAQTVGTINATAKVLQAITVAGTDLAFGNIAPTSSKVVAAASGGTFTVTGSASTPVSVSFGLPANLGNAAVVIGTWTGLSNTVNNAGSASALVPSASATSLTLSGTGNLYVWIGATVTTTSAPVATYTAPVTMTVVYN